MPLFSRKKTEDAVDYKARLERQLYLAKEDPEPTFDISDCNLKAVTSGTYVLCKVLRKTTLILKNNQLLSLSGGGSFSDLVLLETLDISSNKLNKLPDDLKNLKNLKVLKAAHNQIAHLPNSLAQLVNLQDLDLSDNCLCIVPDFIANLPSLQHFDVSLNPLKTLPNLKDSNISTLSQNSIDNKPKLESIRITMAGSSQLKNEIGGGDMEVENIRKMLEARHLQQQELVAKVSSLDQEQKTAVDKVLERQREQQASVLNVAREESQRDLRLSVNDEAHYARFAKDILLGEQQEQKTLHQLRQIEEERSRTLMSALAQQQQLEQSQLTALLASVSERNAPLAALVLKDTALQQSVLAALRDRSQAQEQKLEQSVAEEWRLQQALLAALKEKSDATAQQIAAKILDVQRQLGWLSVCEIGKKEEAGQNMLGEFCEERLGLSAILADLLQRQHKRRRELLDELSHQYDGMEAKLWTLQLQKLLQNVPESLEVQIIEGSSENLNPSAPLLDSPESAQNPTAPVLEECVVCMDAQCEEVFLPCGHICACSKCTRSLSTCPMCRAHIDQTVTIYWPKRA